MKKLLVGFALLLTVSCSGIVHGKSQNVIAKSNSGKTIYVYDKHGQLVTSGKGKVEIKLPRGGNFSFAEFSARKNQFTFKTDNEEKILLPVRTLAYTLGNFFTFGVGYLVDDVTGSGYEFEYNEQLAEELNFK